MASEAAQVKATPTATRRERERDRHQREILAAALELFSRKGFADTTMAEIAERAEFAVGTLYRFFSDKEALYRALMLDSLRAFHQALSAALEGPGTEIEKLERYIDTKAQLFVRHLSAARLYFAHGALAVRLPALTLDREMRKIYDGLVELLESVVRSAVRKKLLVAIEPRLLVVGLEGITNTLLPMLIERPEDFSVEEMVAASKRIFFDQVRLRVAGEKGTGFSSSGRRLM